MARRDHFSIGREISPLSSVYVAPYAPVTLTRDLSVARTAPRRICLRTSSLHAENSPSHHAISFSSWTRYSTSPNTTPYGQLKASALCRASGTSLSYDPPVSEWVYLGAEQPVHMDGKPEVRERWSDWRKRRSPGGSPLSTSVVEVGNGMEFRKQPIKCLSTESRLTSSMEMGYDAGEMATTAKKYGLQDFTCEDLPSAFDSDAEDEDD